MKNLFLSTVLLSVFSVSAVLPGDRPGESRSKLEWLDCSPMPLGKLDKEKHRSIPGLRAVVFMYTRASDSDRLTAMLENFRRQYHDRLLISIITPDTLSDAREFRQRHRDVRLRMAVDIERKVTPEYMHQSAMIFPMAFLMDAGGTILWRGEAVDLPEVCEAQLAGKLDLNKQKKLDPMILEMQQHMRDGNLFKVREAAGKILQFAPENGSALRMAVFAAENLGQTGEAWQAVAGALQKAPDIPRLHFSALDMVSRHRQLRKHLDEVIEKFHARPFAPEVRCAFIERLLTDFPFESRALIGAEKILAGTPAALNAMPEQLGIILMVRSRLRYAFGDLVSAEADAAEAVQYFKSAGLEKARMQAQMQLDFYRTLLKHLDSGK
ncbi:MAG: hypothetical protein E7043_01600 [Lentisphaerae bacterium]|nr:hypothetical protein [Lentisphaerota bacterium]